MNNHLTHEGQVAIPESHPDEIAATEVPEPEAVEAAEADAPTEENTALEDELNLFRTGEDAPEWVKALDAKQRSDEVETWKGIDYNKVMSEASPETQRLMHNFRTTFLRKSEGLADQARAFEQQTQAMKDAKEQLIAERVKLYDTFQHESLTGMLKPAEGTPPPAHTEEGMKWAAREEAKKMVAEWREALVKQVGVEREQYEAIQADRAKATHLEQMEAYSKANPDMWEVFDDIKVIMHKYKLPLEDAHKLARAHKPLPVEKPDPREEARREARGAIRPSRTKRAAPATSAPRDSEAYARYLRSSEENLKEEFARLGKRNGFSYV